jgi:hypothetical protein
VTTVLWALLAFQIKHFLCDFVLQTGFQVQTKKIYGHYGGFIHAGLHALTTVPALLILSASAGALVIIPVVEFVIHYHVDWAKGQIDDRMKWTPQDSAHWILFGFDQLVHQLTYVGIIAFLSGAL